MSTRRGWIKPLVAPHTVHRGTVTFVTPENNASDVALRSFPQYARFSPGMSEPLAGCHILVTGAAHGIGHATCLSLLSRGARVVGIDRDPQPLGELPEDHARFRLIHADVTSDVSISSAIRQLTVPIDVLVTSAGVGGFGPFQSVDESVFRRAMDVNFLGTVRVIKHVLPGMIARRRGHLILLSSISGRIAFPNSSAYCGSKAALEGFAEALRAECAESGIAVSVVNPADVDTDFYQHALRDGLLDRSDARANRQRGMSVGVVADAVAAMVIRPRKQQFLPASRKAIAVMEACLPNLTGSLLVKRRPPLVNFDNAAVALITGASSGIGRELAHQLLARGLTVVLVARDANRLTEAARGWSALPGRAIPLPLDLRDADTVREAIAALADRLQRRVDILVNNAGYSVRGSVLDVPTYKYAENLQTNYFAPIVLMRAILPWMQARGQGQIVNMLSTTAVRGVSSLSSYCATKFALRAVSRCVDRELTAAGINVRVTEVLPGNVDTGFFEHVEHFGVAGSGRPLRAAAVGDVVNAVLRHLERGATTSFVPRRGFVLQVGRAAFPSLLDALEGWRATRLRSNQVR